MAACLARTNAGTSKAIKTPSTAMTTSSSSRVKPSSAAVGWPSPWGIRGSGVVDSTTPVAADGPPVAAGTAGLGILIPGESWSMPFRADLG